MDLFLMNDGSPGPARNAPAPLSRCSSSDLEPVRFIRESS
jgi:hypothetical protein